MKNLLLLLFITFSFALQAQFSQERERNMQLLAVEANEIAYNGTTIEAREAKMVKLFNTYMSSFPSIVAEKELENVVQAIKRDKCSMQSIRGYLNKFTKAPNGVLTDRFVSSFGDVRTNCALKYAVRIYNVVGPDKIASNDLCKTLGCDNNTSIRMMSRGEKTYWKYTGQKRFVTDDEVTGWRYECVNVKVIADKTSDEKTRNASDKGTNDDRLQTGSGSGIPYGDDMVFPPNTKFETVDGSTNEWKKEDLVDIWY